MSIPDWFRDLSPLLQALLATLFTWGVTALGASLVFFFKGVPHRIMNLMLGFAAGVMIAASYWSLLAPAILLAEENENIASWIPAAIGFMGGGLFVGGINRILPHLHPGLETQEGPQSSLRRSILLVLAITLHNIPEGLAIGVAFGAAAGGFEGAKIGRAHV